ncbi:hypothetical protein H2203_003173 [Taxawa tesnikishii (nom. ined.)]|nr:hypothetical protein H2203_003173 [Dothideales sp. JES 119]
MPPRLRFQPKRLRLCTSNAQFPSCQCRYASLATAPSSSASLDATFRASSPIAHYPPTQPPSYKPPEFRKSQLHRQYASLLRSSPLTLLFQHNNLKATEWAGIRRELSAALNKVDAQLAAAGSPDLVGANTRLQIVQTGIFAAALKIVEFYHPDVSDSSRTSHPTDPRVASSASLVDDDTDAGLTHGLSKRAWETARRNRKLAHGLEPLLSGPLMLVTFPAVSPQHLAAALSILAPGGGFAAPKRRTNPGYHEPAVQNGLHKLMLLGARVEGKAFDLDGVRWVGGIDGGLEGLRGQLVAMLQSLGAGLTHTLESAGRSLYVTMEGRKGMLEDEEKAGAEKKDQQI